MSENQVLTTVSDNIGILTLNRPEVMNAFSDTMRGQLLSAARTVCNRPERPLHSHYRSGQGLLRRRGHRQHGQAPGRQHDRGP